MAKKNLYIIAGCNGAGKTTASFTILPEILDCKEFVNADEIARGLSPFQPDNVAIEAGRIMLNRIQELFEANENFAFETTLATKIYKEKILKAQANGYEVTLLFFWLNSPELAIKRVKRRVMEGGHNIKTEVIKRRYFAGIKNLFDIYIDMVDNVRIFDNSLGNPTLIGKSDLKKEFQISDIEKYNNLKSYYGK
jgi:predicted ABC-type ATPase